MKIPYLVLIDHDDEEYDAGESVIKQEDILRWVSRGMAREGFSDYPVVCERIFPVPSAE